MVEPSFAERSVIKHTHYLKNGRLIVSSAINVTATDVLIADGRCIPYDYLVIATGHTHTDSAPLAPSRSLRIDQFKAGVHAFYCYVDTINYEQRVSL